MNLFWSLIVTVIVLVIGWYAVDFFSGRYSKYKKWKRKKLGLCNHNWVSVNNTLKNIVENSWKKLPKRYQHLINWEDYIYYKLPNVSFNIRWNSNLNYVCSLCGKCHNGNSMYSRWIFKKMNKDAKEKEIYENMFKACKKDN